MRKKELASKLLEAIDIGNKLLDIANKQKDQIHYLKVTNMLQETALKEQKEYIDMLENELYSKGEHTDGY